MQNLQINLRRSAGNILFIKFEEQFHLTFIKNYIPHPALRDIVSCIGVIDVKVDDSIADKACPYPPTHMQSLFFYIGDKIRMNRGGDEKFETQARSIIVGAQLKRVNLMVGKHLKAMRVDFHPGGLFRLLGMPMQEFTDEGFDATLILGEHFKNINEQLANAPDFISSKNIVEQFLLNRLKVIQPVHPFDIAMKELVDRHGMISMEELASISCLSLRQFERVCKSRLGITPKLYSRIIRFSKAYQLSERSEKINWTSIAYDCGYFDQMHMIRDFKEFAGVNPSIIETEIADAPVRMQRHFDR